MDADFKVKNGLVVANTVLVANAQNNRVGIGTANASVALDIVATDAMKIPSGNTGQRPAAAGGLFRYNNETNQFEAAYANGTYKELRTDIDPFSANSISGNNISANTLTVNTSFQVPSGNNGQRPVGASNGNFRYNTELRQFEGFGSNTWTQIPAAFSSVRQTFIASANQSSFVVSGGYVPGQVDVFLNGSKLQPTVEYNSSSGSTITLTTPASNGYVLDVVGSGPSFLVSNTFQVVRQSFTASNGQNTFTISGGYVPGMVDVFVNGTKKVNGSGVNISSGTNVVLANNAANGDLVEVIGFLTPPINTASTAAVRQLIVASNGQTTFTVTGGYIPGHVDVFVNGVKKVAGVQVITSSGTDVVLGTGAANGDLVEVIGINYTAAGTALSTPVRQQFTASNGQTIFTVTTGYTPGFLEVYYNGVKLRNGEDVDVSSGTIITLSTGAVNNAIIDVVGQSPSVQYTPMNFTSGGSVTGNVAISGIFTTTANTSTPAMVIVQTGTGQALQANGNANIVGNATITGTLTVGSTVTLGANAVSSMQVPPLIQVQAGDIWEKISDIDLNGQSSVTGVLSANYRLFKMYLIKINRALNASVCLRYSDNNGSSYYTTGSYIRQQIYGVGTTGPTLFNATEALLQLCPSSQGPGETGLIELLWDPGDVGLPNYWLVNSTTYGAGIPAQFLGLVGGRSGPSGRATNYLIFTDTGTFLNGARLIVTGLKN